MSLPFNTTPTYNVTIPSTKENVKFRPFLVKEEKALLIAQHSEDQNVMIDTLKNIIKSCMLDKVNPDTLAMFDIEYLFTQIRAKSVGGWPHQSADGVVLDGGDVEAHPWIAHAMPEQRHVPRTAGRILCYVLQVLHKTHLRCG
jgi:hypothetical protein